MLEESSARVEIYASQETTFFGLNDRVLIPVLALSIMFIVQASIFVITMLIITLILEVVMKFIMRSTWSDFFKIMRAMTIESPRKQVKN
jgi:pilus assembly protein TadC